MAIYTRYGIEVNIVKVYSIDDRDYDNVIVAGIVSGPDPDYVSDYNPNDLRADGGWPEIKSAAEAAGWVAPE